MNNLNYIFFEDFKKLEKLCNEIYSSHNGVTQYIDDMLNVSFYHYRSIPNWNSDLTELKRLRHIRNKIAHEQINENLCTSADIEWLKEFYKRIFNQTDPLSLLRQNTNSTKTTRQIPSKNTHACLNEAATNKSFAKPAIAILLCVVIIAVFCLICGLIFARYLL